MSIIFFKFHYVWYDKNMKRQNKFLLIMKIVAILIVIAYAIGLFRNYGILQASAMAVVAVVIGIDLMFIAKQATEK